MVKKVAQYISTEVNEGELMKVLVATLTGSSNIRNDTGSNLSVGKEHLLSTGWS